MKINKIKPLQKEDFKESKEEITEKMLPKINELINMLNESLTRLDFDNNFVKETFNLKLKTGTAEIITFSNKNKPTRVVLDRADGALVSGFGWDFSGANMVKVTVNLDRSDADCVITLYF